MLIMRLFLGEIFHAFARVEKVFLLLLVGVGAGHWTTRYQVLWDDDVEEGFGDEIGQEEQEVFGLEVGVLWHGGR